jgi:hypothetical protein
MASLIMVDSPNSVVLQLWGHCDSASTSSFACGRLLGLDEYFSCVFSSILYQSNLSALWSMFGCLFVSLRSGSTASNLGFKHLHAQEMGGRIDARRGWAVRPGPTVLRPLWPHFVTPFSPWLILSFWIFAPLFVSFWLYRPRY